MRTIKDPKKKPELRRRTDLDEEEDDNRSSKSTPPKKRRTVKASKDDSSSLNDSGSFADNQSDILSEKSSVVGEDDISDVSSLKSTPPKKRNYHKILNKSPEANGDIHAENEHSPEREQEISEKKGKSKKTLKKNEDKLEVLNEEVGEVSIKKKPVVKKSQKGKKNVNKKPSEDNNEEEDPEVVVKQSPKPKKGNKLTKKKVKTESNESLDNAEPSKKKTVNRKRKLSGHQTDQNIKEDNAENKPNKLESPETVVQEVTITKPKKQRRTKKQLLKEEAQLELKRQTEEQRHAHFDKPVPSDSSIKEKANSEENPTVNTKKKSTPKKKSTKSSLSKKTEKNIETNDKNGNVEVDSNVSHTAAEHTEETDSKKETILKEHPDSEFDDEFEDDDHSDLDTSFDSINSVRYGNDLVDNRINMEPDSKPVSTETDNSFVAEAKVEHSVKCDYCGYVSRSKGGHTRHLKKCKCLPQLNGAEGVDGLTKNQQKIHHCEKCEYSAPRRVLVINHMKSHGIFQCKRCKYRTDCEESLDDHSGQEHKDRSDCKFCKLCNRYVKCSEITLEKHMEECQGRIPFKCPECSKEFQYESSLKCHVVSHYPDQPKLFSCTQCDYKSNYKANLKKHIRHIHEQRGEKDIKCPDCEKMFHTEDNMKRHQKLHSEERPHKCEKEDCDKAFKTINGLKFHLLTHQTDRPFSCEIEGCSKDFKSMRTLAIHINETHQDAPKNFKCTFEGCSMEFYTENYLGKHMNGHQENKTHFCTWVTCSKAFRTPDALKIHMFIHTDEKPLKCEHCDYTCRQKSSLRIHMKKKHSELIPCDLASPKSLTGESLGETTTANIGTTDADPASTYNLDSLVNDTIIKSQTLKVNEKLPNQSESKHNAATMPVNHTSSTHSNGNVSDRVSPSHDNPSSEHDSFIQSPSSNQTQENNNVPSNHSEDKTSTSVNQNHCNSVTSSENSGDAPVSAKGTPSTHVPASELSAKKPKKTDMYEFQSEEESGDEMKPGLLRKEYDKDKPPLPSVTGKIDPSLLTDLNLPHIAENKPADEPEVKVVQKVRKKPGPKPKPKPEKTEEDDGEVKQPKKRGRKKKSETESKIQNDDSENKETKPKPAKRGRSPKAKKEEESKKEETEEVKESPLKKKRGPKKKEKLKNENEVEKVLKKRGRKKKVAKEEEKKKDIEPENGDATINYSEVESSEMFADSKDSTSDQTMDQIETVQQKIEDTITAAAAVPAFEDSIAPIVDQKLDNDNVSDGNRSDSGSDHEAGDENSNEIDNEIDNENIHENITENINTCINENINNTGTENINENVIDNFNENSANKTKLVLPEKIEDKKSDLDSEESSDIGSDFEEDLKPPPAPRPPPMYDSEDGDIESGPENEDFNASAMSNEPLRDFESSREISREISRDFESSREIDDSVKTSDINSVETSTPKDMDGTPSSVNPYRNDSVGNDYDNQETPHPHSHHSSVPHTPSHNSVPTTPIASNQDYESHSIENHRVGDRIMKSQVQGQTNDENTDESSMPEVDKDYVGRFFEEIQCTQTQSEDQITRMNSIDENVKSREKIVASSPSDSVVPSSLTSNPDTSLQMQSPPADLSIKRMEILSPERPHDEFQPRSVESVHRPPSERIPSVPSFDSQYNPLDPYGTSLPPRETILRQPEQNKIQSPANTSSSSFMRFPESEASAMLQRQRMSTPYDRNIQNLHRIADPSIPQHNSSSPLLRHVPGREDVFPGAAGVTGSMSRNPFHGSWSGQDVRPPHWGHPTYLQRSLDQQSGSTSSSLFGKESYLPGREFMFDPSRAAAERNMFSSLASSAHTQRPDIPHDTFQFDRFDLGSYLSSHGYNAAPSLPVDYTRSAHSSTQKSLDDRYRQSSTGVSDFRSLPQTSSASEMFSMNSSFNLDKFYPRDAMYHSQHISDNTNSPFLSGVPSQHSMFGRDYAAHRSFYTQNAPYPFVNMNDKNYTAAASAKLAHSSGSVGQQRDLVPVPRPNMSAPDPQLQDPYRHHSSMLYNMMNRYFD